MCECINTTTKQKSVCGARVCVGGGRVCVCGMVCVCVMVCDMVCVCVGVGVCDMVWVLSVWVWVCVIWCGC